MSEHATLTVLTNGGRRSLNRINTSLGDDSIIDMLKSPQIKRDMAEAELASRSPHKPRRSRKKIKMFSHRDPKRLHSKKSQRLRTPQHAAHEVSQSCSVSPQSLARSTSVPRIETEAITPVSPAPHMVQHGPGPRLTLQEGKTTSNSIPQKLNRFVAWFDRLNHTPSHGHNELSFTPASVNTDGSAVPIGTPSASTMYSALRQKPSWKPTLKNVFKDQQLLQSLMAFTERIYCEENILFLQSVQQCKDQIDQHMDSEEKQFQVENEKIKRDIDFQIISMYNTYIVSDAEYQVNLSYESLNTTLSRREMMGKLSLQQKSEMFDVATAEIERLIINSVLAPYYESSEFAIVAQQRRPRPPKFHMKAYNPFARIRASSTKTTIKVGHNLAHKGMYDTGSTDSDAELHINDGRESPSYDDDVDMRYSPNNKLHTSMDTDDGLFDSADFGCTDVEPIKPIKPMKRHRMTAPSPIITKDTIHRTPSPRSTSHRASFTLSQSHSKSEFESAGCNAVAYGTRTRVSASKSLNVMSPRLGNNLVGGSGFFDRRTSSVSAKPQRRLSDHHVKTMSDGGAGPVFHHKILKLKDADSGTSNSHLKKYAKARAVRVLSDDGNASQTSKGSKKKKKKKKRKKKKVAADDGNVNSMQRKRKHKIKSLKKSKKLGLGKRRRKSNNDSDILMKLYREPKRRSKPTVDIV